MAADLRLDPRRERSPANHPPHIRLQQRIAGQLARSAARDVEFSTAGGELADRPHVGAAGVGIADM